MKVSIVIFSFFLLLTTLTDAQDIDFRFDHLSSKDGLINNSVLCLYQGSRGFLWLGTFNGLNRYDGYNFKEYVNIEGDVNSLSDNRIRAICEDDSGNLWIGTENGLNKFERNNEKFKRYIHKNGDGQNISSNKIRCLVKDRSGDIWIGTQNGLNRFDIKNERFSIYTHNQGDTNSISDNQIQNLLIDHSGTLWIGTLAGGLNKFRRNTDNFKMYVNNPDNPESISSNNISSIFEDHLNLLWIGTADAGLNRFDEVSNNFVRFGYENANLSGLSTNKILNILEDDEGFLWIGTDDAGLNVYDRNTNQFIHIIKNDKTNYGLNDKCIFSSTKDNSGNLWFGTWDSGLNKYDKSVDEFITFSHNPYNPVSLAGNKVYAIYEDGYNELWIGTQYSGLDRFDKYRKKVLHYTHNSKVARGINSNSIYAICSDKEGSIWIGTGDGGLDQFNRETNTFNHFTHSPEDSSSIGGNIITQIICDKYGDLWIGIWGAGLDKYSKKENRFIHYSSDDKVDISNLYSLYIDKNEIIWIGTYGQGLVRFDRKSDNFICYKKDLANPEITLSNDIVSAIIQDEAGFYWIGTNGGGLNKFDPVDKTFKHYTRKNGLANDMVYGILMDDNGNLWISTGNGISRFNPENGKFINYDVNNGLQGNEFNQWACCKGPDGKMYFGGTNGFNVFNPDKIKYNTHIPEIAITDFNLFHKQVGIGYDPNLGRTVLEKSINVADKILLKHDDNIISFEISVLDFRNPMKNLYAYKLEGFDNEWTFKDASQRYVTYTNLSPGKYVFKVKGSNSDGIWNEKGSSLTIIVSHPWWANGLAYSAYGILFLFIFIISTRVYLNRQKLRNQLELEQEHAKKLAEVDRLKSNFFTNISHEFRTPLTLIMGPSDNIITKSNDIEAQNQATIIKRNAGRLLRLINQLLDLSKLDEKKLKLHLTESNIVSFISGIVMSFDAFAERKDVCLKVKSVKNDMRLFFDRDKMENIITNLLSNAIKFTPKGGEVLVFINEKSDETIEIKVKDTGIGIPEKELPKLFDRFYQVDSSQTREYEGSGLGLSLVKELVELHHGTIQVDSRQSVPSEKKSGWSEFIISLPKGSYQLNEDEILSKSETVEFHEEIELDEEYFIPKNQIESEGNGFIKTDKNIVLVVEDNKEVREYIRNFLVPVYIVEEAVNGEQGMRKALDICPDLIISDIMMPIMDGNEMANILKNNEKTSHIPIIFLTAKVDMESKLEGLREGVDAYLTKPFDAHELMAIINNLIENRRKLQEKFSKGEFTFHQTDKRISGLDKNFIDKINGVIERHLSEEQFSIEEMGNETGMSRSQLHRKLTALTGKSPSLYMRSIRLTKAKRMVQEHTANISEIAYSVGFSSPAYFTRCFKEEFGFPPSEINSH